MSKLAREPVRVAVYSAAVAVLGLLVGAGVIDDRLSTAVAAVVSALLAVVTEVARAHVTPVSKPQ